jgi:2-succinyl-5-enolpyruvyl-6-hydroxy-3-cyclohexene-1-carboxylate synthase
VQVDPSGRWIDPEHTAAVAVTADPAALCRALSARLTQECPQSGWGKPEQVETCEAGIREAAQEQLEKFAQTDTELRQELQNGGPERCRLHGGDLVP